MARKKAEPKTIEQEPETGVNAEDMPAESMADEMGMNSPDAEFNAAVDDPDGTVPETGEAPDLTAPEDEGPGPGIGEEDVIFAGGDVSEYGEANGAAVSAVEASGEVGSAFYEDDPTPGEPEQGGEPGGNADETGQDEVEYGSLLSEVSGMGLNDPESAAPLTLPEDEPGAEDGAGFSEGGFDAALAEAESGDPEQGATQPSPDSQPATRRRITTRRRAVSPQRDERVLTIDAHDEVQSEAEREAALWHEIVNAMHTRRILTGTLDSVERTQSGLTLAIVSYNGFRVAIPQKEMMLYSGRMPAGREYEELMIQINRNLNARLGSEIDFIVKGCDSASRSVVASRKDAMLRKRQTFYMDTNELGDTMIYEGRVVQARVVAVAEKIMRVEVFGVECVIRAPGMSWMWIGNARDHYNVGDRVLVRVLRISKPNVYDLKIEADIRSVSSVTSADNLNRCVVQGRYAGRVTDVRGGVVFIRLNNGVNAVAHSCYDARMPGKKDDVSFAVTRLDVEQGVAHGLITRIIRQNI